MKISNKLISNTLYLFLDWFVLILTGFLYWMIAGKTLLPEEYGIVSTSINFAIFFSGISLIGLPTTLNKLIPEYLSKKEGKRITSLIRFSTKVIILTNLSILLVIILLSTSIALLLKVTREVVWISAATLIVLSFYSQFGSVMYGFQRMREFFITDLIGQFAKVIISFILVFFGLKYFSFLVGFLFGHLFATLLRFLFFYFHFSCLSKVKINGRRIMFGYAFPAFTYFFSLLLFSSSPYIFLTIIQNLEVTGIFSVAMLISSILITFQGILASAVFPIISYLSVNKDSQTKQSRLIEVVFRYGLFLSFPIVGFLILFSNPIIQMFSGIEYLQASQLFPILVIGSLVYGLGNIFNLNLYAMGKTKIQRNIVLLTIFIFISLAIPLTSFLKDLGMALAYTLAVFFFAFSSFLYLKKYLKIKLPLKDYIKSFTAALVSFSFLYFVIKCTATATILKYFFAGLFIVFYLVVLIPLNFYKVEDVKVLEFFAQRFSILRRLFLFLANFLLKRIKKSNES